MENIDVNIEETNPEQIIEVRVDENAAQAAIDAAALAQQILELCQGIIENFTVVNTIFVNNGFTKVGQLFTGNAGTEWNINGINYLKASDQEITIPLCASGMVRTDRIVLDTFNNFVLVPGVEVEENPVAESKPVNTLDYTFIPVTDASVGDPTPPTLGNLYQQKEFDKIQLYTGVAPGTDIVIPLNKEGRRVILLQGTIVNIKGLSTSLIYGDSTAENPHEGKIFTFINETPNPIILNHFETSEDIFFIFKSETNLVIPSKERIDFMMRSLVLEEHYKSFVTSQEVYEITKQKYFDIVSNTTLSSIHNNSILRIKANSIITIPSGLPSDFNFVAAIYTGVTYTQVAGSGVTQSPSSISVNGENMLTTIVDGTNNYKTFGS